MSKVYNAEQWAPPIYGYSTNPYVLSSIYLLSRNSSLMLFFCTKCWTTIWFFFCPFSYTGHSYVEDQLDFLSMGTVCTTIMHDQICLDLCRHHSSSATWLASAMLSSWCWAWSVSVPHCSLSVTYTNPSSVSNTVVKGWRAAELYSFLVPLRSPSIERLALAQQEQLEIAMFQVRPLFIGTGNEPINLFSFCATAVINRLFFGHVILPVMSRHFHVVDAWPTWASLEDHVMSYFL